MVCSRARVCVCVRARMRVCVSRVRRLRRPFPPDREFDGRGGRGELKHSHTWSARLLHEDGDCSDASSVPEQGRAQYRKQRFFPIERNRLHELDTPPLRHPLCWHRHRHRHWRRRNFGEVKILVLGRNRSAREKESCGPIAISPGVRAVKSPDSRTASRSRYNGFFQIRNSRRRQLMKKLQEKQKR